ncbi:Uncharacterised protein [Vibrio cholerae]|nr:Uncharacterised protein [Vibrio cholerae]CSI51472.1 Uncharacterised protein [Vibrio cholerae]
MPKNAACEQTHGKVRVPFATVDEYLAHCVDTPVLIHPSKY